jgi:hypothetical protein
MFNDNFNNISAISWRFPNDECFRQVCLINKKKIELNNLLITLELILSTYWNTYITFIVEGDARSFRGRSISFFI